MKEVSEPEQLQSDLGALTKGVGIRRADLKTKVGLLLAQRWSIDLDRDGPGEVRWKVEWQVSRLILACANRREQLLVRVAFNLDSPVAKDLDLTRRQVALGRDDGIGLSGGRSLANIRGSTKELLGNFADSLRLAKPPPAPGYYLQLAAEGATEEQRIAELFGDELPVPEPADTESQAVHGGDIPEAGSNDPRVEEARVRADKGQANQPEDRESKPSATTSDEAEGYIRRSKYHNRFDELIAAGVKCVVLTGLPGIGKTSLAEALAREHLPDQPPIVVRLVEGRINPQDMQLALASIGSAAKPDEVWRAPDAYLTSLLCGGHAPRLVIFDNLDEFREIDRLLPRRTTSTVLVTCRAIGNTTRPHEVMQVGWMEENEAVQLVRNVLPQVSEEGAVLLATSLGRYAILIRLACALYARQPSSITDFCASLEADTALFVERSGYTDAGEDKRLLVILSRLLELLRKENELAYELLVCVAFVDRHPEVDLPFVLAFVRKAFRRTVTDTDLMLAIDALQRYSLVEAWMVRVIMIRFSQGSVGEYGGNTLRMHRTTQKLMKHLLASVSEVANRAALQVLVNNVGALEDKARRRGLLKDMNEKYFPEDVARTSLTAAECYEKLQLVRVNTFTLAAQADLQKIFSTVKSNPGLSIGVIALIVYMPGIPLDVIDFDIVDRPEDGVAVELIGYQFKLIRADKERSYTLSEFKASQDNLPPAISLSQRVGVESTPVVRSIWGNVWMIVDNIIRFRHADS